MSELWMPTTYDPRYKVSSLGRIYSSINGIILKQTLNNKGYPFVNIAGKHPLVHRLVAMAFLPNPESKPHVNHIDNNPLNARLNNLEWVTAGENMTHSANQERHHAHERHWKVKLTSAQVLQIRRLYHEGEPTIELARRFSIDRNYVYNLVKGRTWANLQVDFSNNKV